MDQHWSPDLGLGTPDLDHTHTQTTLHKLKSDSLSLSFFINHFTNTLRVCGLPLTHTHTHTPLHSEYFNVWLDFLPVNYKWRLCLSVQTTTEAENVWS